MTILRHLIKLIWNKKRTHALLLVELVATFLVLFAVMSLLVYKVGNYISPIGYQYDNRWVVSMNWATTPDSIAAPVRQRIKQRVLAYPEVEAVSFSSGNAPFSNGTSNGTQKINGKSVDSYNFWVDEDFARTLDISLLEGRWFTKADDVQSEVLPVIITQTFKEKVYGDEPVVGKIMVSDEDSKDKKRIIGVIGNYKRGGEYEENSPGLFYKIRKDDWQNALILHVRPGTDARFEARMMTELGRIAKGWSFSLNYMTDQRAEKHSQETISTATFIILITFLLINVALGLFGVLNVSISRRRGEIGLRRALGATERSISWQFVGEMWVLATFALLLGLLLAGQFPLLNVFDLDAGVYLTAMAVAVVIIYLLVTLCAVFPSRQAAMVQPAVALHEE